MRKSGSSKQPYIFVGHPNNVCDQPEKLFEHCEAVEIARDVEVDDIAKPPTELDRFGLLVWFQENDAKGWIQASPKASRVLRPYPCDIPMDIDPRRGYYPVLCFERVLLDRASGIVRYDLSSDLDSLTEETLQHFKNQGALLLPMLQRLQTRWRLQHLNAFQLNKLFGVTALRKTLVLGCETPESLEIETNPQNVTDREVIRSILRDNPESQVIYLPNSEARKNQNYLKEIGQLDRRVKIAGEDLGINEICLVVDEVRTIDSRLGIPALISGRPVVVYGTPSYAGLGVTRDIDLEGRERPVLVKKTVNLNCFIGWYFNNAVVFADPVTGNPMSADRYCNTWAPYLGELSDEVADQLVEFACQGPDNDTWLRQFLVLHGHGKDNHIRRLINTMPLDAALERHCDIALAIAVAKARQGNWKKALDIIQLVAERHGEAKIDVIAQSIIKVRISLNSIAESAQFPSYLLTVFRAMPAGMLLKVCSALKARNFHESALAIYYSIPASPEISLLRARCLISLGRFDQAGRTIATLKGPEAETLNLDRFEASNRVGKATRLLKWLFDKCRIRPGRVNQARTTIATLENEEAIIVNLDLLEASNRWEEASRLLKCLIDKSPGDLDLIYRYAKACLNSGDYETAKEMFFRLVRTSLGSTAIRELAGIFIAQMKTPNAIGLLERHLETVSTDGLALKLLADCHAFDNNLEQACECYFLAINVNPLDYTSYSRLLELEGELIDQGENPHARWSERFRELLSSVKQDSVETLLARGRIALLDNDLKQLVRCSRQAVNLFPDDPRSYGWYAHGIAWQPGTRTQQELDLINEYYQISIARAADDSWYTKYDFIRSLSFAGDTDQIRRLLREFGRMIFDSHKHLMGSTQYYAGSTLGDVEMSLEAMRNYLRSYTLEKHAPNFRYARSIHDIKPGEKVLFLTEGGVGDEIRYSLIYRELTRRYPDAIFSVDDRLASLFQRSFPEVRRFVPLRRMHNKRINKDHLDFIDQLPDQAMAPFFDNTVWKEANEADVVVLVQCALLDLCKDFADYGVAEGEILKPDPEKAALWRDRLAPYKDQLIVGISWSGLLPGYIRDVHYVALDDLAPLFAIPNTVFINLQYRDCRDEINLARERYGANIIDFSDLDKINDFEGIAALSKGLDLFVGVNTATTELTGFCGCDTVYIAPTPQHNWRKFRGSEQDVFCPNIRIIQPDPIHEKHTMMERIVEILNEKMRLKTAPNVSTADLEHKTGLPH